MTDQTATCPYCPHPAHAPGVECEGGVDHGPKRGHRCLCFNQPFSGGACHVLMDCQGGKLGYSDVWHLKRGHTLQSSNGPITPDALKTDAAPAVQAPAADRAVPTDRVDGHPQLEAIAAAVWERCGRSDSSMCVEDDPRNIAVAALAALAAVLPAPTNRATVLQEAADHLARQADELWAPGSRAHTVMYADAAELRRMADEAQQPGESR